MIQIRKEAEDIITGKQPKDNNLLKNAPHPLSVITLSEEEWNRSVASSSCARIMADPLVAPTLVRQRLTPCHGSWRESSGQLSLASMTPMATLI